MISIQTNEVLQPKRCIFETLWTISLDDIISDAILLRNQKEILIATINESFYRVSIHDGKIIDKISFQQAQFENVTNCKLLGQTKQDTIVYSCDDTKINFFQLKTKKRQWVDYSKDFYILHMNFISSRAILMIIDTKFIIRFYSQKTRWKKPILKIQIPNNNSHPRNAKTTRISACSLVDGALIAFRLIEGKSDQIL